MKKERIDVLLTQLGYFSSRENAKRAIMAGLVLVNQERVDKPGEKVPVEAVITVKGNVCPYVSRGGLKLEKALQILLSILVLLRVVLRIARYKMGRNCHMQLMWVIIS